MCLVITLLITFPIAISGCWCTICQRLIDVQPLYRGGMLVRVFRSIVLSTSFPSTQRRISTPQYCLHHPLSIIPSRLSRAHSAGHVHPNTAFTTPWVLFHHVFPEHTAPDMYTPILSSPPPAQAYPVSSNEVLATDKEHDITIISPVK
jgi:hypothetical protein